MGPPVQTTGEGEERPRTAPASDAKRHAVIGDRRFINYFSTTSGAFNIGRPHRRERKVQRNKAIFMLVVVLVTFYIVYRLLFR